MNRSVPYLYAARICKNLYSRIRENPLKARVHSVYETSVNLCSEAGMLTVFSSARKLSPYSAVLNADIPKLLKNPRQAGSVLLCDENQMKPLRGADPNDLTIMVTERTEIMGLLIPRLAASADAEQISAYLRTRADDYGISALAYGETPNAFCRYLKPRVCALRSAVRSGDIKAAAAASAEMAGCGVGLTPSSDDLICGYLVALSASGASKELISLTARAAAKKTNDISAALLKRAGEGLASEPVLSLIKALSGASKEWTEECIKETAKLGGSSGLDILTGIYFGVTDAA